MVELYDISKCSFGAVSIARASRVSGLGSVHSRVSSLPNALRGRRKDTAKIEIKPSIQAQDPLSIPLILALSGAQSLVAGGINIADGTYQDWTVQHCLVTGFGFDILHRQAGTSSLDLQNKATTGNTLPDELTGASGTAMAVVARETFLEFVPGSNTKLVDDASVSLQVLGFRKLSVQARPGNVYAETSGGTQVLCDQVAVSSDWDISGSATIANSALSTGKSQAMSLEAMARGTLTVEVMQMGQAAGATPPVNKVVTLQRVKFFNARASLGSQAPGAWDVDFDCEMVSAAGALLALAAMITMADA